MNHEHQEAQEQRQERHEMRGIISEKTPIQVGLVAAAYFFSFSLVVASIWWAATLTNMVSTVLKNQDTQSAVMLTMQSDISELKAWRKVIDASGSPQAVTLAKSIQEVKSELEIHMAQEKAK